jgi:HEPN domain-containing protein
MNRETAKWVRKAEADWEVAHTLAGDIPPPRDIVCFHCQQAAEKYLKSLLQERGLVVPKTHELSDIIDLLLPGDPTLVQLRRQGGSLTRYAVHYRYPGKMANKRQMEAALRHVDQTAWYVAASSIFRRRESRIGKRSWSFATPFLIKSQTIISDLRTFVQCSTGRARGPLLC